MAVRQSGIGPDGQVTYQVSNGSAYGWEQVPFGMDPYAYDAMDREQRIRAQIVNTAQNTQVQNRDYIDWVVGQAMAGQQYGTQNLQDANAQILGGLNASALSAGGFANQALQQQKAAAGTANATDAAIIDALRAYYGGATNLDAAAVQQLAGAQGLSDAEQLGMFQNMLGQTQHYNDIDANMVSWLDQQRKAVQNQTAAGYGPDIQSAAGTAAPSAGSIQAQQAALAQLGAFSGGAGNLSSQMQNVYADPALMQQLFGAAGQYQNAAGGGLALQSAAAGVRSAPEDVARQLAAVQGYSALAGGSKDLSSAMANAYADPNAIALQNAAAQRYMNIASGGADLQSAASGIEADPEAVAMQRAYAHKFALDSNPEISATERYMMENARREEEQGRRAAMDAKLRDLQARGMLGSGEEIAAMLGAQQTTSQNRMLQDLAAQASAQQRAERAAQSGTALAGSMRGSSFGEQLDKASAVDEFGLANRDASMQALGQLAGLAGSQRGASFAETAARAGAADQMAMANRDVQLQGMDQYSQLATQLRQMGLSEAQAAAIAADQMAQSNRSVQLGAMDQHSALLQQLRAAGFDEASARAIAGDQMASANRDFQMQGAQSYLQGAGDVRSQSFGEAYQRGTSNDALAEFNRANSLQQANYNTELQRQQQVAAYERAMGVAGFGANMTAQDYGRLQQLQATGNQIANDQFGRAQTVYGAQTGMTDAAYNRAEQLAQTGIGTNQTAYNRGVQTAEATNTAGQQQFQNQQAVAGVAANARDAAMKAEQDRINALLQGGGLYTGQGLASGGAVADALGGSADMYAGRAAAKALEEGQDNIGNLFGLLS